MNHGKSEQPPVRRIRVLALLILTGLALALGACSKNQPPSDPREIADYFMDLYYARMNAVDLFAGVTRLSRYLRNDRVVFL